MNRSLIFNDIEVSKKEFYDNKKAIPLSSVGINSIVVSNKTENNNETSKYFIGYLNNIDNIVSPLCIILPQMSGYIKYFENGRKNMSFKIEEDQVYIKYNSIWNKIKELLDIKFHSQPIYDDSYIKTKLKSFSEYVCIACISIDSELKIGKKNYPQVYLEQCKYKIKKREPKNFIDYEVDFDSDYD